MKKIDPIDTKILKDLLLDGRKNLSEIAQETNLTTTAIWKRYSEMKRSGIIIGSSIQFDYKSFGYNLIGNIFVELNHNSKRTDYVIKLINKIPKVWNVYRSGKNSLNVIVTLTDISELNFLTEKIVSFEGVVGTQTNIWTAIKNVPEHLSVLSSYIPKRISQKITKKKKPYQKKPGICDKLDWQITEKLAFNGRQSFSKIAKELGVSVSTAINRYNKMKKNNRIRVVIQVNPSKIGYKALGFFYFNSLAIIPRKELVEKLIKIPDVVLLAQTSGKFDYFLMALIRNIEEFLSIKHTLEDMPELSGLSIRLSNLNEKFPSSRQQISTI